MSELLDIAAGYFDANGWDYTRLNEQRILRLDLTGKSGQWMCYVRARDEEHQLIIYSTYPGNIPSERRVAIAEYLTRANHGLVIGNFEMDFADGEIHYKSGIDVTGDRLTAALVDNLFRANALTMDEYLPGITAVNEGAEPADAVARIESPV